MRRERKERLSKSAASGMVALVFLVLGFQLAVFVVKVVERSPVVAGDDATVVAGDGGVDVKRDDGRNVMPVPTGHPEAPADKTAPRSRLGGYPRPSRIYGGARPTASAAPRTYESFAFDPNTVSLSDLQRLGLSERQAESIVHYREKGGRFRSKADFRKMYVVSDTLFARLEPYVEIPKLELNTADSASLVMLHGIGPWYARKILDYRDRLGGFCDKVQLLEIDGIDAERYAGFADAVTVDVGRIRRLDLWRAPDSVLARHPYLGGRWARSIVRYRQVCDSSRRTLSDLLREHVLPVENIEKLRKYIEIQ